MKKILLIGELNDIIRSISSGISNDFQVQICSGQLDMIEGMMKVVKPNMLIFCQIGDVDADGAFFEWMRERKSALPILIITTETDWKKTDVECDGQKWRTLFRPVSTSVIIDVCKKMLDNSSADAAPRYTNVGTYARKRVMIVDDSPLTLRNIKTILQEKYDVFVAPSGEQALKLIPQRRPDVVLLDYEMGGMNGRDTFEAMLADDYMSTIPVIFLTSVADRSKVYGVLKSRPAGYILKPAEQENLFEEIAKVLG